MSLIYPFDSLSLSQRSNFSSRNCRFTRQTSNVHHINPSSFLFTATEELGSSMSTTLPSAPTELSQFPKLCDLRRKFPVLYRVEFQVRTINLDLHPLRSPLPIGDTQRFRALFRASNNNFNLQLTWNLLPAQDGSKWSLKRFLCCSKRF